MKQVIFSLVFMCLSLTGLMAQSYMTLDGKVFKDGVHVFTFQNSTEEREVNDSVGSRSSICDDCIPPDLILEEDPNCPGCKKSLCPGLMVPQLIELSNFDSNLRILRIDIFKLTFCQKDQFELVEVIGKPTDDAIIHGREGLTFVGKDFKLEPDEFYLVKFIVRNPTTGCPIRMRQELFESFYVKACCDTGGNITGTVNFVSERNTVVVNQKGETTTVSKKDTSVYNVTQPVSTFTKVNNDTLLVNVTPDTIQKIQNVTDTLLMQLSSVTTSTNEQQGFENLEIYPNPVLDFLNIDLRGERAEINLLDHQGKLINSKEIDTFGKIDLSHQIPGIYILQAKAMIGGKLHTSVKKISKL